MAVNQDDLKNKLANRVNNPAAQAKDPAKTIHDLLKKLGPEIQRALPKHMDADRLARIALTTIRTNPMLLECNVQSLMGAVMQSAQLGLEPGLLGSCYFIPFNRKVKGPNNSVTWEKDVQFVIGYKGLIDLVRRSGEVLSINAHAVHDNDLFEFEYGLDERLKHVPKIDGERGEVYCYYAYAKFKDGGHSFLVMSVKDIEKIRDKYSKSKSNDGRVYGPWADEFDSMAKKTVIRQLIKYMPISIEIQKTVALDETFRKDLNSEPEYIDITQEPSAEVIDVPIEDSEAV